MFGHVNKTNEKNMEKVQTKKKERIIVCTVAISLLLMACGGAETNQTASDDVKNDVDSISTTSSDAVNETDIAEENTQFTVETEVDETSIDVGSVETDEKIPTEYKTALNKAKTYSDTMHMSKAGLYNQLTSEYGEKFSAEAAQYAVDNLNADWNANALAKAKEYETMYLSKNGLYEQLTSEYGEQFTADEAQYAVDNIDSDWNAHALEKAKEYQSSMDMSSSAIYDQLVSEYGEKFTADEAQYAIDNLE